MHPSIRYDHFIPLMHRLAVLLPPWAPVTMPMLLAVIIGVAQVLRKLRRRSDPGADPAVGRAASLGPPGAAPSVAAASSSQASVRTAVPHAAATKQTPRSAGMAGLASTTGLAAAAAPTPSDARSASSGVTSPSGGAAAQPSRGGGASGGSSSSSSATLKRTNGVTSPTGSSSRSRGASGAQSPLAVAASWAAPAPSQLSRSPASLAHAAEDAYAGARQYILRVRQAATCDAAAASAPSPSRGDGVGSSLGSSGREGFATAHLPVSIRALRPGDACALQRLYAVGQEQHMNDEASARAHARWTRGVLAGDLADPYATYVAGEQRVLYPGKLCFWVATVSRDDFERCAVRGGALAGSVAASGGTSGLVSPSGRSPAPETSPTGCLDSLHVAPSASVNGLRASGILTSAGARADVPAWGRRTVLAAADTLDSDGRVVIGCVAVTPYVPQEAAEDASGTAAAPHAPQATTAALAGELQASQYSDGPAATHAGASPTASPTEDPRVTAAKRGAATGELTRMCVHPAIQRCGLASTLLSHLQAWCSEEGRGYEWVYLSTLATMRPAVRLYAANGFTFVPGCPPDGRREDYCGDVIQVVEMHKALR
jgi:ribosomal protein S18 acetylase RimI-like enzyme